MSAYASPNLANSPARKRGRPPLPVVLHPTRSGRMTTIPRTFMRPWLVR